MVILTRKQREILYINCSRLSRCLYFTIEKSIMVKFGFFLYPSRHRQNVDNPEQIWLLETSDVQALQKRKERLQKEYLLSFVTNWMYAPRHIVPCCEEKNEKVQTDRGTFIILSSQNGMFCSKTIPLQLELMVLLPLSKSFHEKQSTVSTFLHKATCKEVVICAWTLLPRHLLHLEIFLPISCTLWILNNISQIVTA